MEMKVRGRVLAGGASAALLLSALVGSQSALAATPKETVKPSTGLVNGSTVHVAVTGFPASKALTAGQCAMVKAKIACNPGNEKKFKSTASGSGSTTMVVKLSFTGTFTGGGSAGTINCATKSCFIGVGAGGKTGTSVPISFKK